MALSPRLLALLLCWWGTVLAQAPPQGQFMQPAELRRGMHGVGRTVFQGTAIDTFGAEILGVLRDYRGPGQNLILARLSGGPLAQTGVIAGMSGSPVYVEGRLIGAVAYAFLPFPKEPICGITPIHDMLGTLERNLDAPARAGSLRFELDARAAAQVSAALDQPQEASPLTLVPLGTPVWVAGAGPLASQALAKVFGRAGLEILAAPGGLAPADAQPELAPGAALGVQLISGDLNATGIGTLTYLDQDRVLAFGHPMMLAGATDMPMTGAYIHQVFASQYLSYKMGAATRPVGAIRQDRQPAIAGVLGPVPRMLPVSVLLRRQGEEHRFRFGVLPHRDLAPGLTQTVLLQALESSEKLEGDATVVAHGRLHLSQGRVLDREQIYSGPQAIWTAAEELTLPLQILSQTPFSDLMPDSLTFELDLSEKVATAQVLGLRVEQPAPRSGQILRVVVTLQPYQQAPVQQKVELPLPADLPPGPLVLRVGGGAASRQWEHLRRPELFQPRDAAQLLELLGRNERDDDLVVELYRPEPSLSLEGRELPALPPSARAVLDQEHSAGRVGLVAGRVLLRRQVHTALVLEGEQSIELNLRRP
ncbi:MAG: hypothetical protein IT369_21905 [Candidatus Latescibacteria bacterium]|nr:hypothetical protein [Candidatus Latescibacterota bacterium]